MDADDAIYLVEDPGGLQSKGESPGEGSSPMLDTAVQQSRKISRDPTAQDDKEDGA